MEFSQSAKLASSMNVKLVTISALLLSFGLSAQAAEQAMPIQIAAAGTSTAAPALPDVSKFELAWPEQNQGHHSARKSSANSKNKKKIAKKQEPAATEKVEDAAALNSRATHELTVEEKNRAMGIGVSTGTVSLTVDQLDSPFNNPAFQLGLIFQPYQPVGRNQVEGLNSYDMSGLGTSPMGAIELRYMPFRGLGIGGSDMGFVASVGYAQYELNLKTPTGTSVSDARLQTILSEIDFANRYQLRRAHRWSFLQGVGLGRLDSIQSASSTLANGSNDLTFLAARLQAEYQFANRWSVTGGYEWREKIASSTPELGIQNNNFMLGFLGSFR